VEVRGFFLIHRAQAADLKNGGLRYFTSVDSRSPACAEDRFRGNDDERGTGMTSEGLGMTGSAGGCSATFAF